MFIEIEKCSSFCVKCGAVGHAIEEYRHNQGDEKQPVNHSRKYNWLEREDGKSQKDDAHRRKFVDQAYGVARVPGSQ